MIVFVDIATSGAWRGCLHLALLSFGWWFAARAVHLPSFAILRLVTAGGAQVYPELTTSRCSLVVPSMFRPRCRYMFPILLLVAEWLTRDPGGHYRLLRAVSFDLVLGGELAETGTVRVLVDGSGIVDSSVGDFPVEADAMDEGILHVSGSTRGTVEGDIFDGAAQVDDGSTDALFIADYTVEDDIPDEAALVFDGIVDGSRVADGTVEGGIPDEDAEVEDCAVYVRSIAGVVATIEGDIVAKTDTLDDGTADVSSIAHCVFAYYITAPGWHNGCWTSERLQLADSNSGRSVTAEASMVEGDISAVPALWMPAWWTSRASLVASLKTPSLPMRASERWQCGRFGHYSLP